MDGLKKGLKKVEGCCNIGAGTSGRFRAFWMPQEIHTFGLPMDRGDRIDCGLAMFALRNPV